MVLSGDSSCVRGRQDQTAAAACLILTVRANGTSDEAVSKAQSSIWLLPLQMSQNSDGFREQLCGTS